MENKNTVIDAKIGNLNELTKVLSVKEQAQEHYSVPSVTGCKCSPCGAGLWKLIHL